MVADRELLGDTDGGERGITSDEVADIFDDLILVLGPIGALEGLFRRVLARDIVLKRTEGSTGISYQERDPESSCENGSTAP